MKPIFGNQQFNQILAPAMGRNSTIIDLASDYGVKGGVGTDYASNLMQLQAELSAAPGTRYIIRAPGGDVQYSNNRWLYGVMDFILEGNKTRFRPLLTGQQAGTTDSMFHRPFNVGEMLQTNVLSYTGGKQYMNCPKIHTVKAGMSSITVQNVADISDASTYFVGARICVASKETVFRGYPWGCRNVEFVNYITGINGATLTLKYPLFYDHLETNFDYAGSSGGGSGIGRIIPLDNPLHPYPHRAEFKNLTGYSATDDITKSPEGLTFCANILRAEDCVFPMPCYASENLRKWEFIRTKAGGGEFDKMAGHCYSEDSDYTTYTNNGGGCKSLTMLRGSVSDSFQPNFPYTCLKGVTLYPNAIPTVYDAALSGYPGQQPQYRFELEDLRFAGQPNSQATSCISIMPILTLTVGSVTAAGAIVILFNGDPNSAALQVYKCLDAGFALWKKGGANGGRVSAITCDSSFADANGNIGAFVISGTWATPPAAGEIWEYRHTDILIDRGGHKALDKRPIFAGDTAQFRNNLELSKNRILNFGPEQLKPNSFINLDLHAFVLGAELRINQAQTDGKMKITANVNPGEGTYTDIVCFSLSNTNARKFDRYSNYGLNLIDGGEPGQDQLVTGTVGMWVSTLQIYCGNIPATGFSDFSLLLQTRSY